MRGADGMSVIQTIAAGDYKKFGTFLLRDKNGAMVDLIEKDHKGAESVTETILKKWLASDAPTRTYQHLIGCLRQSELGALAELIANRTGTSLYIARDDISETGDEEQAMTDKKILDLNKEISEMKRQKEELGDKLTELDYKLKEKNDQLLLEEAKKASDWCRNVPVESNIPDSVCTLTGDYSEMLMALRKAKLPKEKLLTLKEFLSGCCEDIPFNQCPSLNMVVKKLADNIRICIFNVDTLWLCCTKQLLERDTSQAVCQYKEKLDEFFGRTSVKSLQLSLKYDWVKNPNLNIIVLKLKVTCSVDTLRNLRKLVYHFFGNTSKALNLHIVSTGSICVTWTAPVTLVTTLREKAEQLSPDYLASKGVIELVIAGKQIAPKEAVRTTTIATTTIAQKQVDPEIKKPKLKTDKGKKRDVKRKKKIAVAVGEESDIKPRSRTTTAQVAPVVKSDDDESGDSHSSEQQAVGVASTEMGNETELIVLREDEEKCDKFEIEQEGSDELLTYSTKKEELEHELEAVQKENFEYEEKCNKLKVELAQQSYHFGERSMELKSELEAVRKEKLEYKEKSDKLRVEQKETTKKCFHFEEKLMNLNGELEAVQKEKLEYEEELRVELEQMALQNHYLDERLMAQNGDLKALWNEKLEYEEKCNKLEVELEQITQQNDYLEERLMAQNGDLEAIRKEKLDYEEKCKMVRVELAQQNLRLSMEQKKEVEILKQKDSVSQKDFESMIVKAFKQGNKQDAEQLLHGQRGQLVYIITTTTRQGLWDAKFVSLLHLAATHGWMNIINDLIRKYNCDINCKDSHGDTPLHYAASNNHLKVVMYFINIQHRNSMTRNNIGDTPLHYACRYGHFDITHYLIRVVNCSPSCENNDGETPLHYACKYGHAQIVKYLLSTGKVDPLAKNKYGETPIYKSDYNLGSLPLLHLAAAHGWLDIVIDLITKYKCSTNYKDSHGHTPLHYAARKNYLMVVRYLINEQNCDPMTKGDNDGDTPLHLACRYGHLIIAKYLICEVCCNPSCENKNGETPLHLACHVGHAHIVHYLLSTGKVNPLANNKYGMTPVNCASIHHKCYDLLKLFQSFPQCKRDFPVHTYTKVVLTGYSGAGKTTISQLILLLASKETRLSSLLSSGRVTDVECLTAGIIPLHVESKVSEVGNMVIYDFAGRQEYYSSHAAVLEHIMKNSAAVFVCIVDLSQSRNKISESIHYWISFIENTCSSAQGSSHIIIVGSHADLVKSTQELKKKNSLVESIAESRVKQLTYAGFVSMDCRLLKTKEARRFCSLLSTSQQAILSYQPSMSWYCHVLYAFLCTKLGKAGCTLLELTSALASVDSILTESLTSLSDKGLILFIQNQEHPQSSWVVVEKKALLGEVNGTLFAPDNYRQVASNTGIVSIATIKELFPQYSTEMLVGCLDSMEFCHPVDISKLQATTNLEPCNKAASSSTPPRVNHLFFPSLIKEHRPYYLLPSPRFGWCLGCSNPQQFFSNRFLHVLLLRLVFMFSLASKNRPPFLSLLGFEQQCTVWQNGISWKSVSGVSTVVEIVDHNRWIIVLVSERSREAAETCSSVIRMILNLQHQLCSAVVTTCECLISPSLLDRYPFDALPDTDLFDLPTVARSMLHHHNLILDRKEGKNKLLTDKALSYEPYYLLQPSSVCQLFNQSMASQPVPYPLLQEVIRHCQQSHQKPRDHKELRECVNKHSIFAGRNPLEVAELKEEDIISHTATATQLPTAPAGVSVNFFRTLTINDLCDVLTVICDINDWKALGVHLGLKSDTLANIETYRRYQLNECRIDMLSAWLQQKDEVSEIGIPSWAILLSAIKESSGNLLFAGRDPLEVMMAKDISYIATAGISSGTLTVNDLCDVLAVIHDLKDWKDLGLQLGLFRCSLEMIDLKHRSGINCCKIEMLVAWLQLQDNVTLKGDPSWSVLKAALKRMGQHEIADRIG